MNNLRSPETANQKPDNRDQLAQLGAKIFRILENKGNLPKNFDEKAFLDPKNEYALAASDDFQNIVPSDFTVNDLQTAELTSNGEFNLKFQHPTNEQWVKLPAHHSFIRALEWQKSEPDLSRRTLQKTIETRTDAVRRIKTHEARTAESLTSGPSLTVNAATIRAAEQEASNGTDNINEVLQRKNFMAVVHYVSQTVGIPASALLSVMYSETRFKFDPNLDGPGGEKGIGQFMPSTWKFIRRRKEFKNAVSPFIGNVKTIGRAENLLADIAAIGVLLKRGLDRDIDHTTQLTDLEMERMRFHYHVPAYRRIITEGKTNHPRYQEAVSFMEKIKARERRKGRETGQYGYQYFADNARRFQAAMGEDIPTVATAPGTRPAAPTAPIEYPTSDGSSKAEELSLNEFHGIFLNNPEIQKTLKESGVEVSMNGETLVLEIKKTGEKIELTQKTPNSIEYKLSKDGKEVIRGIAKMEGNELIFSVINSETGKPIVEVKGKMHDFSSAEFTFHKPDGTKEKLMMSEAGNKDLLKKHYPEISKKLEGTYSEITGKKPGETLDTTGEFETTNGSLGKYKFLPNTPLVFGSSTVSGNNNGYEGIVNHFDKPMSHFGISGASPERLQMEFIKRGYPILREKGIKYTEAILAGPAWNLINNGKDHEEALESYKKAQRNANAVGLNMKFTTIQPHTNPKKNAEVIAFNQALMSDPAFQGKVIDLRPITTKADGTWAYGAMADDKIHMNEEAGKQSAKKIEDSLDT